jgi:asparagine synthase (glutamine-hydrolysing)
MWNDAEGSYEKGIDPIWITFNGEIYNYLELREELIRKGHQFKTNSDTEVILKSYEQWGMDCISRFRGMFAFALWDARSKKLFLVRDRIGVKPLYYYQDGQLLLFASELKALMAHREFKRDLNPEAVALYLRFGYVPSPLCIFANTYKVRPGSYVEVSADSSVREVCYWNLLEFSEAPILQKSEAEIEGELLSILCEAFSYRLVSDVPVGLFLSGGIDSSLIAAILKCEVGSSIGAFTVGFDDANRDESLWARAVARHLGLEHIEMRCSVQEALDIVPKLPEIYDEPIGDNSAIPTYLLCKTAREHVKVALSGDGGDELFCGYKSYTGFNILWEMASSIPIPLRAPLSRLVGSVPTNILAMFINLFSDIDTSELRDRVALWSSTIRTFDFLEAFVSSRSVWFQNELSYLTPDLQAAVALNDFPRIDRDPMTTMMLVDSKTFLPDDLMVKVDRASMSVGLEAREPLLDHKLVEYALSLPLNFKYSHRTSKYILKRILYKYVPRELVDRPKRGFEVPLGKWLRGPLKSLVLEYLNPRRIREEGILSPNYVQKTVNDFLAGVRISPRKIWHLLVFELWYERWLKNRTQSL